MKDFNTTGVCYSKIHYMMDNSHKISDVMNLIERGKYFTLNRPRQYGKTTTLHFLMEQLKKKEDYLAIRLTFEDVRDVSHQSDDAFAEMFMVKMKEGFRQVDNTIYELLQKTQIKGDTLTNLSTAITTITHAANKKLVMLIDEVDASSNYISFLRFLAMLRTKYLNRMSDFDKTFHSIILAGVHDIKSLKYKLRNSADAQYNSPWNIAVDFKVEMSFNPKEIAPMLEQYSEAEDVTMDIPVIAERLYYHTAGYPFLVSRLCKIV
ncbi:MAG: AAA family ATPase, partial [Chitinophagales bacterium]